MGILATVGSSLSEILSWHVLVSLPTDAAKILLAKIIRQISFGFMYVLVIYLTEIGFAADKVGLLFFCTLLGDAIVSTTFTSFADKFGRKRVLLLASTLSIMAGFIVATQHNFAVFAVGMTTGIISVSGSDCGPFMAVELSCISEVSDATYRTKIMAWYNLFSCFASASGSLLAGRILAYYETYTSHGLEESCRRVMGLYVVLHMCMFAVYTTLGPDIERSASPADVSDTAYSGRSPSTVKPEHPVKPERSVSNKDLRGGESEKRDDRQSDTHTYEIFGLRKSKWVVLKLSLLFMLDAFAGGFVLHSVISNWFHTRYGTSPATLGTVFFVCGLVAGVASLFAARIADFIGLVLTMVFTHMPAQICLMLIPIMPNQLLAITLLCLRATVGGMDVPARNSFVQWVVDPGGW